MIISSIIQHLTPTLVLSLLTISIFLHKLHRYYTSPLRAANVPGPFLAKFTSLYRTYYVFRRRWHWDMVALHEKYGPVVWIAPREVLVNDIKYRDTIYSFASKDENTFFKKARMFETGLINEDLTFLFELEPPKARFGKYTLSHMYSESSLRDYESDFDSCIDGLVDGLRKYHIEAGTPSVNLTEWFQYFAYDLASMLTSSEPAGMCAAGGDVGFANFALRKIMDVVGSLMFVPIAIEITNSAIRRFLLNTELEQIYAAMLKTTINGKTKAERIDTIRTGKPGYFLTKFYQAQEKLRPRYPKGNSTDAITNHIFNLVAGSAGVTPNALSPILDHILHNKAEFEKSMKELEQASIKTNGKGISTSSYFPFDGPQSELSYFQACIKEGIRLSPPLSFSLLRTVPNSGTTIAGHFIPPGYDIGMAAWPVHHNKSFIGPDASIFRPDRWFESHPTLRTRDGSEPLPMKKHIENNWIAFGAGARVCLGRHIAQNVMMKVTARLLLEFDIEVVERPKEWFGFVVHQDRFMVKLSDRLKPGRDVSSS